MIDKDFFETLFEIKVVLVLYLRKEPKSVKILQQIFAFTDRINEAMTLFQDGSSCLVIVYFFQQAFIEIQRRDIGKWDCIFQSFPQKDKVLSLSRYIVFDYWCFHVYPQL
jgi:hypothetical protein